jgi:hypothetical protein
MEIGLLFDRLVLKDPQILDQLSKMVSLNFKFHTLTQIWPLNNGINLELEIKVWKVHFWDQKNQPHDRRKSIFKTKIAL